MGKIQDGKLLYHLTKLSNLDSIIKNGLVSRKHLLNNALIFDDVADDEIINKRTELNLNTYIPFHFHPNSSFDTAVKKSHINDDFIYICIKREYAKENDFKIIASHPLSVQHINLLSYDDGVKAIDWNAMEQSSTSSSNAKETRMAECLTDKIISVSNFQSIAVKDEATKKMVKQKLSLIDIHSVFVDIQPWAKNN